MRVLRPTLSDELFDGPPEKAHNAGLTRIGMPSRSAMTAPIAACSKPISKRISAARPHPVGLDPLRVVHHRAPDPEHRSVEIAIRNAAGADPALRRIRASHAKREVERRAALNGLDPTASYRGTSSGCTIVMNSAALGVMSRSSPRRR